MVNRLAARVVPTNDSLWFIVITAFAHDNGGRACQQLSLADGTAYYVLRTYTVVPGLHILLEYGML